MSRYHVVSLFDLCCLFCLNLSVKTAIEMEQRNGDKENGTVMMDDDPRTKLLLPLDVEEKLQENLVQVRIIHSPDILHFVSTPPPPHDPLNITHIVHTVGL